MFSIVTIRRSFTNKGTRSFTNNMMQPNNNGGNNFLLFLAIMNTAFILYYRKPRGGAGGAAGAAGAGGTGQLLPA